MCGIAVAIDWAGAESAVRQLVAGILHRGDVTDPVFSPRRDTAMCTRRLRIVDGEHAIQPQASPDGRLLGFIQWRDLQPRRIARRTRSPRHSIQNRIRHRSAGRRRCRLGASKRCERLVGMYAFVAVDATTGDFLAVRDPFGVKPLYLINTGPGFLFCSEIRPLLSATETGDVMLLPPGYLLTRTQCSPYVSAITASTAPVSNGRGDLDLLLSEAVYTRLPPGLPAALMFSGGIGSTLVAHYARRFRPEMPGNFLAIAALLVTILPSVMRIRPD